MTCFRSFWLGVFLLCPQAQAATYALQTQGQEALYQTRLPLRIYLESRASDWGDLSIQNAAGESLPVVILSDASTRALTTTIEQDMPFFALQARQMADAQALSVAIQTQSGQIQIETKGAGDATAPVYLADLGGQHAPVQALTLDWKGADSQLTMTEVLASDDLQNWQSVGQGVLLQTQQTSIQNRIVLDSVVTARYLQIKPANALQLTHLKIQQQGIGTKPEILWQNAVFLKREQDKNGQVSLDFESPSRQTAQYWDVKLPDDNTMTQVTVLARNQENEPWQTVTYSALYRIHQAGKVRQHAPIATSTTARYWRLQFNQQHGGIGQQNPQLVLGWVPDILVWNARGQAPFSLQVGESTQANHVGVRTLLPQYQTNQPLTLPVAPLETAPTNPTEHHVSPWSDETNFKSAFLWAGLLIGVLLLAAMVRALLKHPPKNPE